MKERFSRYQSWYTIKVDDQLYYWGLYCFRPKIDHVEIHKNTINGDHFYSLLNLKDVEDHRQFEFMEISAIRAKINIPKIIKITCPNVKAIMNNNGYCKEIGMLTLSRLRRQIHSIPHRNCRVVQTKSMSTEGCSLKCDLTS